MQLRRPHTAGVLGGGAVRRAGAAAKADDIFMRALLCEGAVSALERYAHAFHDVQLTVRSSTPKEFHARGRINFPRFTSDTLKHGNCLRVENNQTKYSKEYSFFLEIRYTYRRKKSQSH